MRKFLIGLLTFILINVIGLLILSFTLKTLLVDGIIKEVIVSQADLPIFEKSNYQYNDESIDKVTNNERLKELLKSNEVTELIDKYLDIIIDSYIDENNLNRIELEKDMIKYLDNNKETIEKITGQEIKQETINQTKEEIKEMGIDTRIKESIKTTSKNMPKETVNVLNGYKSFISLKFRLVLIGISILCLILIALLQKSFYKWIKLFAISLTTNGIFAIIVSGVVYLIIYSVTKVKFNTMSLLITGIIITIIGIVIHIIYNIVTKNIEDKEVQINEVSQIS